MLPSWRLSPSMHARARFSKPAMADSVRARSQPSALRRAPSAPLRKAGGPRHLPARATAAPTAAAT
eukprot:11875248-Alexandrium_andersonii.AAC.1